MIDSMNNPLSEGDSVVFLVPCGRRLEKGTVVRPTKKGATIAWTEPRGDRMSNFEASRPSSYIHKVEVCHG